MNAENLIIGKTYIYSSYYIDCDVVYDGIENSGLTFYKFKSTKLDVTYRLWKHEIESKIKEK